MRSGINREMFTDQKYTHGKTSICKQSYKKNKGAGRNKELMERKVKMEQRLKSMLDFSLLQSFLLRSKRNTTE